MRILRYERRVKHVKLLAILQTVLTFAVNSDLAEDRLAKGERYITNSFKCQDLTLME
jgi:hypothetical protein